MFLFANLIMRQARHGVHLLALLTACIRMVWRIVPFQLAITSLLTIILGLAPLASVWLSKVFLDALVYAFAHGPAALSKVFAVIAIQLTLQLFLSVLGNYSEHVRLSMSRHIALFMRESILRRASQVDFSLYDDSEFYNRLKRASAETGAKPLLLIYSSSVLVRSVITFASLGILVFTFDSNVFLMMLLCTLPMIWVQVAFSRKKFEIEYSRTHDMRMSIYLESMQTDRRIIPEICINNLWTFLRNRWRTHAESFNNQDIDLSRRRTLWETVIESGVTIARACATAYIVFVGFAKRGLTVGQVMMYIGSFYSALDSLRTTVGQANSIYEGLLFFSNYQEFQNSPTSPTSHSKGTRAVSSNIKSIEFKDVSFCYPGSATYALRSINLKLDASISTLVVGVNGSGKTTLIKLLAGLYEPCEGQILIDGIDIREYDIAQWRQRLGVVFQDFVRYPMTARENIGVGNVDRIHDVDSIRGAARLSSADEFLSALPNEYETFLSKEYFDGHDLSVGEWQRICIARLFLKNPPVVVFDEPTACLDVEAEISLLNEIARLARDRICVLISHRMFRKTLAEQIIVMGKGQVIEMGTFEDLMSMKGRFYKIWKGKQHGMIFP